MVRLTRAGVSLASAGFTLLALGLGMANLELLLLSAFPLFLLALSLARRPTDAPLVERTLSTLAPRRGEPFDMTIRIAAGAAAASVIEAHAPLPASFVLEEGSNLAQRAGVGDAASVSARVRASARGRHTLEPVRVETIEPTGLVGPRVEDATDAAVVEVAPRSYAIRRVRARARRASGDLMSDLENARLGVDSTDFRELREYVRGDPPSAIHWKATARRLSALGKRGGRMANPLVSEYEKEGKRTVIVLLDGGPALRVGTSLETGLDHGVEAALGAAKFFLARGARVGAATYGASSHPPSPPEAGSGQEHSLERSLSPGELDPENSLARTLRALHPHLAGARPLLVVVTRVTPRNADELADAAQRIRALSKERRRRLRGLLVVDVRALDLAPAPSTPWETARELVHREDAAAATRVAQAGARVVGWRPGVEDLRTALSRGGMA